MNGILPSYVNLIYTLTTHLMINSNINYCKHVCYLLPLLLLSSCVVYNHDSTNLRFQSNSINNKTKIKTNEDKKYKLNWIDINGDNVYSILNTKKDMYDIDKVQSIINVNDSEVLKVKEVTKSYGNYLITTIDDDRNYFLIEKNDNQIFGIRKTGKDTLTVNIPRDQISDVKIINKAKSTTGNIAIAVAATLGVLIGIASMNVHIDPF